MKLNRKSRYISKSKKFGYLPFLLPSFAGVLAFVIAPFCRVILYSVKTTATDEFCGLENYRTVFLNEAFLLAAKNTAKFDAVCLPLLIGLSLLLAVWLSKSRLIQKIKSAWLFPLAVPSATLVLVWKMLFEKNGIINAGLLKIGMEGPDWMGGSLSFYVLVISYIWKNLGYTDRKSVV